MKEFKIILGMALCIIGIVLTILPGSILIVLAGLVLLSTEYTPARRILKKVQKGMSASARKLDAFLYKRKYK